MLLHRVSPFLFILLLTVAAGCSGSKEAAEEAPAMEEPPPSVVGDWEGRLNAVGASLRIIFHIQEDADGTLSATLDSPDQGASGIRVDDVSFEDGVLRMEARAIGGSYVGTLQEDGALIDGSWTQGGQSFALDLRRTG